MDLHDVRSGKSSLGHGEKTLASGHVLSSTEGSQPTLGSMETAWETFRSMEFTIYFLRISSPVWNVQQAMFDYWRAISYPFGDTPCELIHFWVMNGSCHWGFLESCVVTWSALDATWPTMAFFGTARFLLQIYLSVSLSICLDLSLFLLPLYLCIYPYIHPSSSFFSFFSISVDEHDDICPHQWQIFFL